ncbi:MAG: hypothetical protein R2704_16530 [Microthrixaceae bacterium]
MLDLHLRHRLGGGAALSRTQHHAQQRQQILRDEGRLEERSGRSCCGATAIPTAPSSGRRWRQSDPGFGVATARLIRRHLKACGLCEAEQQRHLAPAAMFSLRADPGPHRWRCTQAAGALLGSGVPMGAAAPDAAPGGGVESGPGGSEGGAPSAAAPSGGSPPPAPTWLRPAMAVVEGGGSARPVPSRVGPVDESAIDPADDDAVPPERGEARKLAAVMSRVAVLALLLGGWLVFGGDDVRTAPVARQGAPRPRRRPPPSTTSSTPSSTSVVGPTTAVSRNGTGAAADVVRAAGPAVGPTRADAEEVTPAPAGSPGSARRAPPSPSTGQPRRDRPRWR